MYIQILAIFAFVTLVQSESIDIWRNYNVEGRKIYDRKHEASPGIWRRSEKLEIRTNEKICRVSVTDLRPDHRGCVQIIDGGLDKNYVTIEIKSPTIFRGYSFKIEIYAVPENDTLTPDSKEDEDNDIIVTPTNIPEDPVNTEEPETDSTTKLPETTESVTTVPFTDNPDNSEDTTVDSDYTKIDVRDNDDKNIMK